MCLLQRRHRARRVECIPRLQIGVGRGDTRAAGALRLLARPARSARMHISREVHLQIRVRQDDRADVAPLHDDAPAGCDRRVDHGSLAAHEALADLRHRRHAAHRIGDRSIPDVRGHIPAIHRHSGVGGIITQHDDRLIAARSNGLGVVHVHTLLEHPPGHRAIHRTRVDVVQAQALRDSPRSARLA